MEKKKIAIVVQRFHPSIAGGSEAEAYQYAKLLSDHYNVDVITTTALNSSDWRNELHEGVDFMDGFQVLRFPVSQGRTEIWERFNHELNLEYFYHKARSAHSESSKTGSYIGWTPTLQEEWIRHQGPHSESLIQYLRQNQSSYFRIIFITYLYSPSYFGSRETHESRFIFVPTLHDEPPAYMSVYKYMANRAKEIIWNSEEEKIIAERIWEIKKPGKVIGAGVDLNLTEAAAKKARELLSDSYDKTHEISSGNLKNLINIIKNNYIIYFGRIEPGKGIFRLIQYFNNYIKKYKNKDLKLYLAGSLNCEVPSNDRIRYLGFLPREDLYILISRAKAFIMPSWNESLSLATLEAMALGVPVLVSDRSAAVAGHIKRSGGGILFKEAAKYNDSPLDYILSVFKAESEYSSNEPEFAEALHTILSDADAAWSMGLRGQKYVSENFCFSVIQRKLLSLLKPY